MEKLQWSLGELEQKLNQQVMHMEEKLSFLQRDNNSMRRKIDEQEDENRQMKKKIQNLQMQQSQQDLTSHDVKRIEWVIPNISEKLQNKVKGNSIWSPEFSQRGVNGIQLEFFPKGRENSTTIDGFCSLFLWCPSVTRIKYQLSIGNHIRAPDEDTYDGKMGHGHSNFCQLDQEINKEKDEIVLQVDIIDLEKVDKVSVDARQNGNSSDNSQQQNGQISVYSGQMRSLVEREFQVLRNKNINRIEWRLTEMTKKLKNLPKGCSLYSPLFTQQGISDILLEFYPNGSQNTTKSDEGFCQFYIRCPESTQIIVTLFVGNFKKGPIIQNFDGSQGKGLPDFCELQPEIQDDQLVIGLDIQNQQQEKEQKKTTLRLTS